jgi:hypothetical protein
MASWNIWRVRQRWLRVLVAWAMLLVMLALAAAALVPLVLIFVFVGAYRGIRAEFADAFDDDWRPIWAAAWRALSGKELA